MSPSVQCKGPACVQEELHRVQWRTGIMAAAGCATTVASIVAAVYACIMSRKVHIRHPPGCPLYLLPWLPSTSGAQESVCRKLEGALHAEVCRGMRPVTCCRPRYA